MIKHLIFFFPCTWEMWKINGLRNCTVWISYFLPCLSFDLYCFSNICHVFAAKVSFSLAGLSESYGCAFRFFTRHKRRLFLSPSICFCTTTKNRKYICAHIHQSISAGFSRFLFLFIIYIYLFRHNTKCFWCWFLIWLSLYSWLNKIIYLNSRLKARNTTFKNISN